MRNISEIPSIRDMTDGLVENMSGIESGHVLQLRNSQHRSVSGFAETALCWEFLRLRPRPTPLGSRSREDGGRGPLSGRSILNAYRKTTEILWISVV